MASSDKLKSPLYADGWYVLDFFGQAAYADIGLCLVGKPPSKAVSAVTPNGTKLERRVARRSPEMKLKADRSYGRVYFNELRQPIDARYYKHVLAEYPDATFHLPSKASDKNPIPIKSGGKIVGAVMCLQVG